MHTTIVTFLTPAGLTLITTGHGYNQATAEQNATRYATDLDWDGTQGPLQIKR
jgi:hypothetical protein